MCCEDAPKIKPIFGEHVVVKLDLFHGMKRTWKFLPKKIGLRKQFARDVRLCFRQDGDFQLKRTKPTASPEKIREGLENLREKYDGRICQKTHHELDKILTHVDKGCLRYFA